MSDAVKIQATIRQNAEEVSNYMSELVKWEKDARRRDQELKERKHLKVSVLPPRSGSGTIPVSR